MINNLKCGSQDLTLQTVLGGWGPPPSDRPMAVVLSVIASSRQSSTLYNLFVTHRGEGINAGSAMGRDIAGQQRGHENEKDHCAQG